MPIPPGNLKKATDNARVIQEQSETRETTVNSEEELSTSIAKSEQLLRTILHQLPLAGSDAIALLDVAKVLDLSQGYLDDHRRFWQLTTEEGVTYRCEERYTDRTETRISPVFL